MGLDDILGDFTTAGGPTKSGLNGGTVTIWLSAEDKARYDRLQEQSNRRFSKKAREALILLMDLAEQRAG